MAGDEGAPLEAIAKALWATNEDLAWIALHHPFVRGLADGSLTRSAYQHYLAQDWLYLELYSEAYKKAKEQAAGLAEADRVLQELLQSVQDEQKLQTGYLKEEDISATKLSTPATTAYTNFLSESAKEGLTHLLTAMAPCIRLYGFLGTRLKAAYPHSKHEFSDWVTSYASPAYLAGPAKHERVLASLCKGHISGRMQQLYRRAMQLEVDFFSAQPFQPAASIPVALVVTDFDDTMLEGETTAVIVQTAADTSTSGLSKEQRTEAWTELVADYGPARAAFLDSILPVREASPPSSYDAAWTERFLQESAAFDRRMNDAAISSGVLTGAPPAAFAEAGRRLQLRGDCTAACERLHAAGIDLQVVSVSWSGAMLRGALDAHLALDRRKGEASAIRLHSNELSTSGDGDRTSGEITRQVQTALDKRSLMRRLKDEAGGRTLYVGDSITDLGALLTADIGIIMGCNATLRRIAAAAGITIAPLVTAPRYEDPPAGTLFYTSSWHEVAAFALPTETAATDAASTASDLQQAQSADHQAPVNGHANGQALASRAHGRSHAATESQANGHGSAAPQVPTALTIAGSDSGGGAGIQADLKTFQACGVFGMSAVSALTAQNTHGVQGIHVPPAAFLKSQIDAVLEDIGADAVKTGMLPNAEAVAAVAAAVRQHSIRTLVVDPVLVATSGHSLADTDVAHAIVDKLMNLATLITPNLAEAAALLQDDAPISTVAGMEDAARRLQQLGAQAVLIKGGHLESEGDAEAVDVFYDGSSMQRLSGPCISSTNTHGTGCTLAAAIAAELAKGAGPLTAVRAAKGYLTEALRRSMHLQIGHGRHGPLNHGFDISDWAALNRTQIDLRVYGVTSPECNQKAGRSNAEAVVQAIRGGMTIVQLREKLADGGHFLQEARAVIAVARPLGVPVIINDRIDVALAAGADGVHVGQEDLPAGAVRRLIGPGKILGVSCKTVEQALQAEADGADYLGVGAVCATPTKDSRVIGLDGLVKVCQASRLPVVAIGGLNASNASSAILAGAMGIAVVRDIFASPDPAKASAELRHAIDGAASIPI